jgi:ribose 5-phosphate isomerase RpiB
MYSGQVFPYRGVGGAVLSEAEHFTRGLTFCHTGMRVSPTAPSVSGVVRAALVKSVPKERICRSEELPQLLQNIILSDQSQSISLLDMSSRS